MWLLAGTHALEPVGRMLQRQVAHAHGWKLGFAGRENVFRRPLLINVRIVFVVPFLLHQTVARAAFTAMVEKRCFFAHVASEGRGIVAKAGGKADQKALGILQQGLEGIGILPAIMPG